MASKVTIRNSDEPRPICVEEIPQWTYFLGTVGDFQEELFLRLEKSVIIVREPWRGWAPYCTVKDFRAVDLEITVKNQRS